MSFARGGSSPLIRTIVDDYPSTTNCTISVKLYVLKFPALSSKVNSLTPHVPGAEPSGKITTVVKSLH